MKILEQFGNIPADYAAIEVALEEYRSPKDKVAGLEKQGYLIRIKKGLYVVSPQLQGMTLSKELIANHLYGPSYVSLESALSFYGLIPERVHTTRSITMKRAKRYSTPIGNFDYVKVSEAYYEIGIRQEVVDNRYAYLIATPEKAICDLIITTPCLRLQSEKAVQAYLEEDLRLDFAGLKAIDTDIIRQCMETGMKKTELTQLYKFLSR